MEVIDRSTGEVKQAQIFVAVLGCSSYTYAEATWTQSLSNWFGAHVRALEWFSGSPAAFVPDNLKAAYIAGIVTTRSEPSVRRVCGVLQRSHPTCAHQKAPRQSQS
jgi:transposase